MSISSTTHHKRRTKPKKACRRHAILFTPHAVWGHRPPLIPQRVEDTPSYLPHMQCGETQTTTDTPACRRHAIPLTPHAVWGDTDHPPHTVWGPKTHQHELHNIILPHRHPHLPQRTHHQRGTRTGTIRLHPRHSKESEMPNLPHRRHCRPYTHVRIIAIIPFAGLIRATSENRQQQMAESKSSLSTLLWLGTRVCRIQL